MYSYIRAAGGGSGPEFVGQIEIPAGHGEIMIIKQILYNLAGAGDVKSKQLLAAIAATTYLCLFYREGGFKN